VVSAAAIRRSKTRRPATAWAATAVSSTRARTNTSRCAA